MNGHCSADLWKAASAAVLLLVAVHPPAADAQATTHDRVTLEGCEDVIALIPASAEDVRRYGPDIDEARYRIVGEELGTATLVVRIFACDSVAVPGSRPRPTLGAQFGVTIESPDDTGRLFGTDACCNWYTFFWVTDNKDFAGWLKEGTGLGGMVRHVKHLVYRNWPGLGSPMATIHFAAGEPTPSPFEVEVTVAAAPKPWPGADISPNWWAETGQGGIKIGSHVPSFHPYEAHGEVRTRAGTQMAVLFDGETRSFGTPLSYYGTWDRSFTTKTSEAKVSDPPRTSTLRVRRDVKTFTRQERRDFVRAIRALKAAPSPFDSGLSYYDQFVAWHLSLYPCGMGHEMMRPHGGPMFLPWHRLFLLRFENALRKVSGKPITVPYWDWTDPASTPSVFARDFMGGDGDPDDDFAVKTGPFRKGRWTLRVHPIGSQWSPSATPYLTRRFGSLPGFTSLPAPADVRFVQERPRYDVAPYDTSSDPNLSFRNALEGFWQNAGPARVPAGAMACGPDGVMSTASGPAMHNHVHVWVGGLLGASATGPRAGTMVLPTSPNDPVFFLHHANIDRLWAEWQETHGTGTYEPATCDLPEVGCSGNTGTDRMYPPFEASPSDVANVRALGYRYDSMSARPSNTTPLAATSSRVAASSFRCEQYRPA